LYPKKHKTKAAQNTAENRQRLAENGGKANPFDNDNPFQGGNAY